MQPGLCWCRDGRDHFKLDPKISFTNALSKIFIQKLSLTVDNHQFGRPIYNSIFSRTQLTLDKSHLLEAKKQQTNIYTTKHAHSHRQKPYLVKVTMIEELTMKNCY